MAGDFFSDGPQVSIDIIEDARWREVNGQVIEIVRVVKASGFVIPDPASAKDMLLNLMLNAPNVPDPGDPHPHRPELIVQDRDVRALSTRIAMATITYRLPDGGSFPPSGEPFRLTGGTGIEQISTQLDRNGNQITVEHEGVMQGGYITPYEARSEIIAERVELTSNPLAVTAFWTNSVNDGGTWALEGNSPAGTWLIAGINFELINSNTVPFSWRFVYNFRQNPDGFDPQVVFIDPTTGNPPPGLTPGVGFKTIPWHVPLDFSAL